jgi:ammonium transporter Rh
MERRQLNLNNQQVSPLQLLVMTLLGLVGHSFNFKVLMTGALKVADMGGTYIDHMFGAYFGLAVAFVLGAPNSEPEMVTF